MIDPSVAAIAVALLSAVVSLIVWLDGRKRNKVETTKITVETDKTRSEMVSIEAEAAARAVGASGEALEHWRNIANSLDAKLTDANHRISALEAALGQMTRELTEAKTDALKTKRYAAALEYIVDKVRDKFPIDVQITEKIARGELALPPVPYGNGA